MKWSKEPPTEAYRYYWKRHLGQVSVAFTVPDSDTGGLRDLACKYPSTSNAEWAGPITAPEEP